jgi:hypothetical protein
VATPPSEENNKYLGKSQPETSYLATRNSEQDSNNNIMSAPNSNNMICPDQQSALEGLIALSGAPPILAGSTVEDVSEAKPKHRRFCSVDACTNRVVQGGVCVAHGAKRRKCSVEGCDKNIKKEGKCSMHG